MTKTYTKGPWQTNGSHVYSADPERELIAQVIGMPLIGNLNLIAVSPELLQALKDATDQLERAVSGDRIDTAVVNDLLKRALIAKAEGGVK